MSYILCYHPLVVLWIRFQRCCLCTSVRACNLAKARITGNVISNGILQITKTEARKSEGVGLCDKQRDVDFLTEIEAAQDEFGLKKSVFRFNIPEKFLNKSFCKSVIVSLV